ncbi:ABC transporter permease, partial [Streptococcus suis]
CLQSRVPSLWTLIANALKADILENNTWICLPAAIFILVMMLCINYVGEAFQRAADA